MILESVTDSAEWNLEVERVLSQLKVSVRTDIKVRASISTNHFLLKLQRVKKNLMITA